jgi:K+-sensing histidine kinase KdpD
MDLVNIRSCVSYVLSILNNTLDVSKLACNKLTFSVENVYLRNAILESSLSMLSSMVPKDVKVSLRCEADVFVVADPLRLQQVILNLLTNAFKFTQAGEVLVLVCLSQELDANRLQRVIIEVRDTGPGIPVVSRSNLLRQTEPMSVKLGAGLGLSLSYNLIKAMNGSIYLDGTYSAGSSFIIELQGGLNPRVVEEASPPVRSVTQSALRAPSGLRLMLVDDSRAASKLLRRRIEMHSEVTRSWTAACEVCFSGEEALKVCRLWSGAFDGMAT